MTAAAIIYAVCAMGVSSLAARYHSVSGIPAQPAPGRMTFYISLLRFAALVVFILLAYPALFDLTEPARAASVIARPADTTFGLLAVLAVAATLSWLFTADRLATWVLLVQGILFLTWLFGRIMGALNQPFSPLPDWRFLGVTLVLFSACLLISEILLWLPGKDSSGPQQRTLTHMARQLAVLPAILIYSLGLGLRL